MAASLPFGAVEEVEHVPRERRLEILLRMLPTTRTDAWFRLKPDFATAWGGCRDPSVMVRVVEGCLPYDPDATLLACDLARAALRAVPEADPRLAGVIDTAERFAGGGVSEGGRMSVRRGREGGA